MQIQFALNTLNTDSNACTFSVTCLPANKQFERKTNNQLTKLHRIWQSTVHLQYRIQCPTLQNKIPVNDQSQLKTVDAHPFVHQRSRAQKRVLKSAQENVAVLHLGQPVTHITSTIPQLLQNNIKQHRPMSNYAVYKWLPPTMCVKRLDALSDLGQFWKIILHCDFFSLPQQCICYGDNLLLFCSRCSSHVVFFF